MKSDVLVTFSGKFGDILWSLPTVRQISRKCGQPVNFGIMPAYSSLLPLLNDQPYICDAFTMTNWICTGSPYGDQPWLAPGGEYFREAYHLTYRSHPHTKLPLVAAENGGVILQDPVVPWIEVNNPGPVPFGAYVAVGFNPMYHDLKQSFLRGVRSMLPHITFVDVTTSSWKNAADIIQHALCFLGCRSALHVLAHGVAAKVIIFEPDPPRSWDIFKSPWGTEVQVQTAIEAVRAIGSLYADWKENQECAFYNRTPENAVTDKPSSN